MTVTRGEEGGGLWGVGGKKGKDRQGTCIPHGQRQWGRGGRIKCGKQGWVGWRRVMRE